MGGPDIPGCWQSSRACARVEIARAATRDQSALPCADHASAWILKRRKEFPSTHLQTLHLLHAADAAVLGRATVTAGTRFCCWRAESAACDTPGGAGGLNPREGADILLYVPSGSSVLHTTPVDITRLWRVGRLAFCRALWWFWRWPFTDVCGMGALCGH